MQSFQPLSDQVLVRILPFEEKIKSIWVPETVDHGRLPIRQGIVVALGCGDAVAPKCDECNGSGYAVHDNSGIGLDPETHACDECDATGYLPHARTEFTVKVGDRVLIHPRPWAEITRDGETLAILHEDQHVIAVIDDGE